ncbi:hypothetical protein D556_2721 [Bordetella holmesii 41130]|uniref:N-acetyltransferase YedL n=1 Tax=Bordetella holmesii 1058 TaxID=1247648 RepID=A0ABN0RVY0_9BORD|nr:hypothetical protein D558_2725 [Bordetella holmesii 44057]EWM42106.1 hypothetical protein D556_2721 [Bordetella holmesii 41130]EWM47971.1 hypothetical protein D555_2766 [Bordetella holmesii 35009]EWM48947.1 hypothetical protein D557_2014 [Bordetella holmesii 70147]EXX93422.1 hypothetical protein D559_0813 [Bordetella holmesii 1058]
MPADGHLRGIRCHAGHHPAKAPDPASKAPAGQRGAPARQPSTDALRHLAVKIQ